MKQLTMYGIRAHKTPPGSLTLWWLGQAGFLIGSPAGKILALDPYLSNSCKAIGRENDFDMDRQIPPPISPAELAGIDAYLLTHSHQDHLDPETVAGYRAAGGHGPYLAPAETCERLQTLGIPASETRMIWPNKNN